jgi:hypothetical protein
MTEAILLALINGMVTLLASVIVVWRASLAANAATIAARDAVTASRESKNAIADVHKDINGKMAQLIAAKEDVARAAGKVETEEKYRAISAIEATTMSSQVSELWTYLRSRALAESFAKGLISSRGLSIVLSHNVKDWYATMSPDLVSWYSDKHDMSDDELFIDCHKTFGKRLTREICEPYGVFDGACVALAILVAKDGFLASPVC